MIAAYLKVAKPANSPCKMCFSKGDLLALHQPLPGATPNRPRQDDHRHRQVDVSLSSCGLCLWLWDDPAVVVLCRPRDESLLQVPTQQTTKEKKKRPNLAPVYLVARLISRRRRRLAPSGEDLQTSGRQARSNLTATETSVSVFAFSFVFSFVCETGRVKNTH